MTTELNGADVEPPPVKPDPDPVLIERAQRGDRQALRDLLEEVGPAVRQWALSYTGDPDAAADLVQEVFLVVLEKLRTFRGDARFLSWLFSVTRNQALEAIRKKKRHERKMSRFTTRANASRQVGNPGETDVDRDRLRGLLGAFVRELPPRQREVFQMAELQGLSSPEIGAILQVEPVSVRAALLKARRTLRRKILQAHPEWVEEYLP